MITEARDYARRMRGCRDFVRTPPVADLAAHLPTLWLTVFFLTVTAIRRG